LLKICSWLKRRSRTMSLLFLEN